MSALIDSGVLEVHLNPDDIHQHSVCKCWMHRTVMEPLCVAPAQIEDRERTTHIHTQTRV